MTSRDVTRDILLITALLMLARLVYPS